MEGTGEAGDEVASGAVADRVDRLERRDGHGPAGLGFGLGLGPGEGLDEGDDLRNGIPLGGGPEK
nr:hypothetical protein [Intrasporangium chromatireducens]